MSKFNFDLNMEPLSLTRKEIRGNQFNVHSHQLIKTWINFHFIGWQVSVHKSSNKLKYNQN